MMTRRQFGGSFVGGFGALTLPFPLLAEKKSYPPVKLSEGRYTQSWFLESFLELGDDLAEAGQAKKRFAILWEQDGCPYCREMHIVNFAIPAIHDYVVRNFEIIQLDIRGSREVTDFAGNTMSERDLAKAWKVRYTPTIQFITGDGRTAAGNDPKFFEVARMPGYLRPIHFLWMFEFVRDQAYDKADFRTYVVGKVAEYETAGKNFPDWATN